MSKYSEVTAWFESLPQGEVRGLVEPLVDVADRMFMLEAAVECGGAEVLAECRAKLKASVNDFFGWGDAKDED